MRRWVLATATLVAMAGGAGTIDGAEAPPVELDTPREEPTSPALQGEGSSEIEKSSPAPQVRGSAVARTAERGLAVPTFDKSVLWRLAGGMAAVVAMAVGLLWAHRRWGGGGARLSTSGGLQVLGRTALSPKHFVYVLRLEDRRIVVGVSGERMTPLAVCEEPPLVGTPFAKRAEPRALEPKAEPPVRPSTITDDDLIPYRRQVSRLRDMLRNHRGDLLDGKDPL